MANLVGALGSVIVLVSKLKWRGTEKDTGHQHLSSKYIYAHIHRPMHIYTHKRVYTYVHTYTYIRGRKSV